MIPSTLRDLQILDIFDIYDGCPVLFICGRAEFYYLAVAHSIEDNTVSFLYAPITKSQIQQLEQQQVDFYSVYKNATVVYKSTVARSDDNEIIEAINPVDLTIDDLPYEGIYLNKK